MIFSNILNTLKSGHCSIIFKDDHFLDFCKSQKMSFWPARAQKADHGTALGRLLFGYKSKNEVLKPSLKSRLQFSLHLLILKLILKNKAT